MEYRLFTIVRYNYRDYNKSLPVARHKFLAPFIATDDDDVVIDTLQLKLTNVLFAAALLHNSHQAGVLMAP